MEAAGRPLFPAMSDGRQFTDYSPRCASGLPQGVNCHDYKDRMISSAEEQIRAHRDAAAGSAGGAWCAAGEAAVPGYELLATCTTRACTYSATGAAEPIGISTDNTRMGSS
jgi:hypothetical protein